MKNYVTKAATVGAKYTALTAFLSGLALSLYWMEGKIEALLLLAIGYIPAIAIAGWALGGVIFGLCAVLFCKVGADHNAGSMKYAIAGLFIALIPLLTFTTWAGGTDIIAALQGKRGTYQILIPGMLAAVAAGFLVGRAMTRSD